MEATTILTRGGSAHLLEGAASAEMTNEQRIRGADAGVDCALVVTGYDRDQLTEVAASEWLVEQLPRHRASTPTVAVYQLAYSLSASEIGASSLLGDRARQQAPLRDVAP